MDIVAIINSCKYENENSKTDFKKWLKAVAPLFDGKNAKDVLNDKQQLKKMFYLQKNSLVSGQSYSKIKRHINTLQDFFDMPHIVPTREYVLKSRETICLYKNLESLIRFIDNVGESSFYNYNPLCDLLNVKAIAILGWHGFSLAEVASLEKNALNKSDNDYFVEKTAIDAKSFEILKNFAAAEEYRGMPSGILQKYKSSDIYLFRSTIAGQNFTENHIASVLKRFNHKASMFSGAIVFRNLRKNALFVDIAENMSAENLSQKIEKLFGCDIKTAYRIKLQFLQWQKDVLLQD